jgi:hypothetical protein
MIAEGPINPDTKENARAAGGRAGVVVFIDRLDTEELA